MVKCSLYAPVPYRTALRRFDKLSMTQTLKLRTEVCHPEPVEGCGRTFKWIHWCDASFDVAWHGYCFLPWPVKNVPPLLPYGALFNPFFIIGSLENTVHIYTRNMNRIGIQLSGLYQFLNFNNRGFATHCHYTVEITGGFVE